MKKTISIIALLMFTVMSGLSLADRDEDVKIRFTGGEKKNKVEEQKTSLSAKKERAKSVEKKGNSPAPSLNNY